jgi:predicted nucleic acid-binding Zn ribbon protein
MPTAFCFPLQKVWYDESMTNKFDKRQKNIKIVVIVVAALTAVGLVAPMLVGGGGI